jgi:hypothetical protein
MSEQTILAVVIPTVTVLVGILINNHRINDVNQRFTALETHMTSQFSALEKLFTEKLLRVEQVMDARLTRIEQELKLR